MTYDVQAHINNRLSGPIPKGVHVVRDTLRLTQCYGYKLTGYGGQIRNEKQPVNPRMQATVLAWEGPPDKPVLELSGCTGYVMEGVNILARNASQGILIRDAGGSLNIAIRDLGIVGGTVGIQCGTEVGEQTCANITYDNCHFQEQREACVRMMNMQSLEHLFLRPEFAFAPVAIDVVNGGDVTVIGGGSYEIGALLKLGTVGRNCRGFDVMSLRVDGKITRTAWVTYADPKKTKTFGPITFRNCTQNNGQQESTLPLLTAAPGSRVVCRDCSFDGGYKNWAAVYSDRTAGGEMVIENCDGLEGDKLNTYVNAVGDRAYYEFRRCGTLYGPVGSYSTFPDQTKGGQFTDAEVDDLRALLGSRDAIATAVGVTERIRAGELRAVFPSE